MKESFAEYLHKINKSYCADVPSMIEAHLFIDDLIYLLFPIKQNKNINQREIEIKLERMKLRLKELLIPLTKDLKKQPDSVVDDFFTTLPMIYQKLLDDAEEFLLSDPAASCVEEIILSYPGFLALTVYRISHVLYLLKIPVLPRMISEYVHGKTGIDIHPGADIGDKFFIDHGTGIVIGATAKVGNGVKVYQGVTLGALFVEKKMQNMKRHPTIEDNVIIYAGSTILGGETVVGHDTIIGGNVWLTESVVPFSVVYRQHKTIVRDSKNYKEPLNFVI